MNTVRVVVLAGLMMLGGVRTPLQAQNLVTLADLVNNNGSLVVEDKVFDSFRIGTNSIVNDLTGRSAVNLDNILVTPLPGDPLNPGIEFSTLVNELKITQKGPLPASLDLDVIFRVAAPAPRIKDNSLIAYFDGAEAGVSYNRDYQAEVRETVWKDSLLSDPVIDSTDKFTEKDRNLRADVSANLFVDESGIPFALAFAPPLLQEIWVLKTLTLTTRSDTEFAEIIRFQQYFSQSAGPVVPEPSTLALASVGIGVLAVLSWRRRRRAAGQQVT